MAADARCRRVVALIDMDCFYCEVERRQNPSLVGVPMAVVQYNPFENEDHSVLSQGKDQDRTDNNSNGSIIAVSYEARAAGVTRSMRGRQARSVCPAIQLVQVPTAHAKADLELYRDAGAKVLAILAAGGTTERASVDEAYVDCTVEARRRLRAARQGGKPGVRALLAAAASSSAGGTDPGSHVSVAAATAGGAKAANEVSRDDVRSGHAQQGARPATRTAETQAWWARPLGGTDQLGRSCWSEDELMLAAGAAVVAELRAAVRSRLGYSCSAGIAHNKILAKLCAGLHKPNQQTILPLASTTALLHPLDISRLRGLGAKLGSRVKSELGCETVGQLAQIPRSRLIRVFGEATAAMLERLAQGEDDAEVQNRSLPKSIGCGKTFRNSYWGHGISGVGLSVDARAKLQQQQQQQQKTAAAAVDPASPTKDRQGWVLQVPACIRFINRQLER